MVAGFSAHSCCSKSKNPRQAEANTAFPSPNFTLLNLFNNRQCPETRWPVLSIFSQFKKITCCTRAVTYCTRAGKNVHGLHVKVLSNSHQSWCTPACACWMTVWTNPCLLLHWRQYHYYQSSKWQTAMLSFSTWRQKSVSIIQVTNNCAVIQHLKTRGISPQSHSWGHGRDRWRMFHLTAWSKSGQQNWEEEESAVMTPRPGRHAAAGLSW